MEIENKIRIGANVETFEGRNITFCVTEECNLKCKYCYMAKKNNVRKMSFEVAKKAVDYVLNNREEFNDDAVIWDFIGGEPFLEIDLIDKITDYIKIQMYKLNHPWFHNYRLSFSSNGLLYKTEKVQNYIKKNKGNLSIGLSVDGNKIKHDQQRIRLDGSGSFDEVVENAKLWIEQFKYASTKATFASEDIKYLKDSIVELWDIGIKDVSANVVFEDVWKEGDDLIYEEQLKALGDYVIENKIWNQYSVRFFDYSIGLPLSEEDKERNFCGAGKMVAIDCEGNLFPCIRFLDLSLCNHEGRSMGSIYKGIDKNVVRAFDALTLRNQSSEECINCEVATGCAWCSGFNYDDTENGTIYKRATHHCKMHKANVRATEYFWKRYSEVTGLESPREEFKRKRLRKINGNKFMMFITADNITPHCNYESRKESNVVMSKEIFQKGIKFTEEYDYIPFLLNSENSELNKTEEYGQYFNFVSRGSIEKANAKSLVITDLNEVKNTEKFMKSENVIVQVTRDSIDKLGDVIQNAYGKISRINVNIKDLEVWGSKEVEMYSEELDKIIEFIKNRYGKETDSVINIISELLNMKNMNNCGAGEDTFALAPNGKIYLCPAFYFENPDDYVGDLEKGIYKLDKESYDIKNSPICSKCDAYHCKRCKFLNKKLTKEMRVPSKIQCEISHIERNSSKELQKYLLSKNIQFDNIIKDIDYLDPLEKILERKDG